MGFIYVAEYERMPLALGQFFQAADERSLMAEQTVVNTGASAQSAAFTSTTKLVRVHTDSVCSIAFGTNPTATTAMKRMAANTTEYFGVPPGLSWKIAVVLNT